MIVSAGTPQQVLDWFQKEDERHEVLCIFLAESKSDQLLVADFVNDFCTMDAAMGDNVGFILFYPESGSPLGARKAGKMIVFPGQLLTEERQKEEPIPLRETFRELSLTDENLGLKYAEIIAQQMAVFVPELMSLLNVSYSQLPAMCVVVKDYNECRVLALGRSWKPGVVVDWLQRLASIVKDSSHTIYSQAVCEPLVSKAGTVLQSMKDLDTSLGKKSLTLAESFERWCKAANCSTDDRSQIAAFLSKKWFSIDALESLLLHLGFESPQCFKDFGQLRKIRRIISEVELIDSRLDEEMRAMALPQTVPILLETLERRRCEIYRQLNLTSFPGAIVRIPLASGTIAGTLGPMADFINKWGGALTKVMSGFAWMGHLLL